MVEGCRVRPSDVNNLGEAHCLENSEETTHGNITIKCSISERDLDDIVTKTLTVGSREGGEFCTPVLHQFVTVCKHSQQDLFPEPRRNELFNMSCVCRCAWNASHATT